MKKANLNTINGRFRHVRTTKGLTQEEFGKDLGLTRMGVNAIEVGRYAPVIEVLMKIKKRYNVSYSWMIDGGTEDVEIDALTRENESLKKTLKDQADMIDTLKKYIAVIEKK